MGPPANLPSWGGLVDRLASHADAYSPSRGASIREQKAGDLLAAIDLYEIGNVVPKVDRATLLREIFATSADQVTETARLLTGIGASTIITTNYDNVLRYAFKDREVELIHNSAEDLRAALSCLGNKPMLIQLHGRAIAYDAMVLGSGSYERLTHRAEYVQLLRQVFLHYCVLAVGFGFSDPPFQRLLAYVGQELSGAGQQSHVAILGQSARVDQLLLRAANFEILSYDDSANHDDVRALLRELRTEALAIPPPSSAGTSPTVIAGPVTSELARIYASLTAEHRGQAFDLAAAAVVAHGLAERPLREDVLVTKVARMMALSEKIALRLVARGVLLLKQSASIVDGAGVLSVSRELSAGEREVAIVAALNARLGSLDKRVGRSAATRAAALDVVKRVMLVQGMTAARAFVDADPPDAYSTLSPPVLPSWALRWIDRTRLGLSTQPSERRYGTSFGSFARKINRARVRGALDARRPPRCCGLNGGGSRAPVRGFSRRMVSSGAHSSMLSEAGTLGTSPHPPPG